MWLAGGTRDIRSARRRRRTAQAGSPEKFCAMAEPARASARMADADFIVWQLREGRDGRMRCSLLRRPRLMPRLVMQTGGKRGRPLWLVGKAAGLEWWSGRAQTRASRRLVGKRRRSHTPQHRGNCPPSLPFGRRGGFPFAAIAPVLGLAWPWPQKELSQSGAGARRRVRGHANSCLFFVHHNTAWCYSRHATSGCVGPVRPVGEAIRRLPPPLSIHGVGAACQTAGRPP